MTSKELVPLHSRELARTDEPSICPQFDRRVEAVLADVVVLVKDRTIFPDDRRAGMQYDTAKLRGLVDRVESGTWPEPIPETRPAEADTVQLGQKSILELTEDEFAERWDMMTRGDKLAWIMDVTDK